MSEPYLGEIKMFAGNYAPRGYALCNGAILPIAENTALYSILDNYYGGDGRSTFALPDLADRAPVHFGDGPGLTNRQLGEFGGLSEVRLQDATIPPHTHQMRVADEGKTGVPANTTSVAPPPGSRRGPGPGIFGDAENLVPMSTDGLMNTGGDQSHENRQPYQVINFIIALSGVYPSRN
jgi:microcystin-dependent protein